MKKNLFLIFFQFSVFLFQSLSASPYDLTIVSNINHADGIGRISIGVIETLKNDLEINCIAQNMKITDVSDDVQAIVQDPDKTPGNVSILFNPIWYAKNKWFKKEQLFYKAVPNSKIKIAYSMLEGTRIPLEWVKILNSYFNAVVVPDHFLVDVYKNCGVTIPIFELPIGMDLDEYLHKPKRSRPSTPFVFGTTVSCDERKNYSLLIQSFAAEFGNCENVILKLNSRQGMPQVYRDLIQSLNVSNIIFNHSVLNQSQYFDFIDSFDCFINISKGEGFSLCPREALALGIPCILTRNSAQITLCDSGLIREIPSEIPEPTTYFGLFGDQQVGEFMSCTQEDVQAAMRDVYENYNFYLKKAKNGPQWVSQYCWINQKNKYLSLIKPKQVVLGEHNVITEDYLMTNSYKLYKKYCAAFNFNLLH